jgi:hypothetical protein
MTDPDAEPSDQSSANGSHLRPRGVALENKEYGTRWMSGDLTASGRSSQRQNN